MADTDVLYYEDLAKLLKRDIGTLRKDAMLGKLPPMHKPFGHKGRVIFLRDEVENWLRSPVGANSRKAK